MATWTMHTDWDREVTRTDVVRKVLCNSCGIVGSGTCIQSRACRCMRQFVALHGRFLGYWTVTRLGSVRKVGSARLTRAAASWHAAGRAGRHKFPPVFRVGETSG